MSERVIDTAVIPVAGLGTRMAPFTAGEPKFMAGITEGDKYRPNIDYTLDDCIAANISNLIFVVSNGGDEHLRKYLGPMNPDVQSQYLKLGKHKELEAEHERREIFRSMNIEYIEQRTDDPYGTAIPLSLARAALSGVQHFAITGGDDFVWHVDGASELSLAVTAWQDNTADHAIMGNPIMDRQEATKYGILRRDEDGYLISIDEKPPLERIPENPLANISRYILTSELIWPHLDTVLAQQRSSDQPEYYITDVINLAMDAGEKIHIHPVQGMYFDAGSPQNILQASINISAEIKKSGK